MVSREDNSVTFLVIHTICSLTFIEYVVHWRWVQNSACEEINIYLNEKHALLLLFIHISNATVFLNAKLDQLSCLCTLLC